MSKEFDSVYDDVENTLHLDREALEELESTMPVDMDLEEYAQHRIVYFHDILAACEGDVQRAIVVWETLEA